MSETLRLIALGGYGEIGKNCTVLECAGQILIIDFGVAFPDEAQGRLVDLLVPNFNWLRERRDRIVGIFLTHGHEDHIGAVPTLLRDLQTPGTPPIPVYGGRLTIGMLRVKLGGRAQECNLNPVEPGTRVPLGPFEVEPVHINHSIPDAFGLAIRTPAGLVYHSGDFKFDQTPIDGRPTDFAALARLGDEGVRLMISDSTNVRRPGVTPSEATVGRAFDRVFPRVRGRLIVATFASQIHRLQQVLDAADRLGKKVLIAGRSMERNASVARDLGHLHYRDDVRLTYGQLSDYPDDQVVILITGSQGEPVSGLTRMAGGSHPKLRLHPTDTVLFSATPIPGNETTIYQVINQLMRRGAQVITAAQEPVHVSGHASSEEIKLLYNLVRPKTCVPFHGEYRHMVAFGELAMDLGQSHEDIYFVQNGDVLRLDDEGAALEAQIEHGVWSLEGQRLSESGVQDNVLADRGFLAASGVISAALAWDYARGELVGRPRISLRGVRLPSGREHDEFVTAAAEQLEVRLALLAATERSDPVLVERATKRALRSYFEKATRSYPVLAVHIVGLNEPFGAPAAETNGEPGAALLVEGEVGHPLALSLDDLVALRPESAEDDESISLSLARLLAEAQARLAGSWLALYGPGEALLASLPLSLVEASARLVFGQDDQPLDPADGGPIAWELAAPAEPATAAWRRFGDVRRLVLGRTKVTDTQ